MTEQDRGSSGVDANAVARLFNLAEPSRPSSGPKPDDSKNSGRVMIIGLPRSGSTWLGRTLSNAAAVTYVPEPDNMDRNIAAGAAMRWRGSYPMLEPRERARGMNRMYSAAFEGRGNGGSMRDALAGRLADSVAFKARKLFVDPARPHVPLKLAAASRIARPAMPETTSAIRLVKSVHMPLSIDWLREWFAPRIVVTRRHPLSVLASWIELSINPISAGWQRLSAGDFDSLAERLGMPPRPAADVRSAASITWVICFLLSELDDAARRHPEIVIADHEIICRDPLGEMRYIAGQVGLTWTDEADEFVIGSNRTGKGYKTHRVARQVVGNWRERLTPEQLFEAQAVLAGFPISARYEELPD